MLDYHTALAVAELYFRPMHGCVCEWLCKNHSVIVNFIVTVYSVFSCQPVSISACMQHTREGNLDPFPCIWGGGGIKSKENGFLDLQWKIVIFPPSRLEKCPLMYLMFCEWELSIFQTVFRGHIHKIHMHVILLW